METSIAAIFSSVSEEIAEISRSFGNSVAVSCNGKSYSYSELDKAAHQFSAYLRQQGVPSGGAVAICMDRSFNWIVAALGTMRAGAAYVPLDAAWPDERLRYAIEDSEATVLVARTELLERLRVKIKGVDPSRMAEQVASAPPSALQSIDANSLAYVIYTSGSTGVPKGIEVTHDNLAHLIRWHRDAFRVSSQDRASHLAGLGFDAAVWEMWCNLSAGATLCLIDEEARSSPDLIQRWILREGVTLCFVPTVLASPLIKMQWPAQTPLRFLLTGGETLLHGPSPFLPFKVVNNYGPTECTVVATSAVLSPGLDQTPPIGRPIAGTEIYLLDEAGTQVADGDVGELYIGGKLVSRGYRNLPDANDKFFLPDPFARVPGARMYKTGDRGVRRADGQIEFRGRIDRQVKIRGYRIELDEIGSTLTRHPDLDFATAITRKSSGGEVQIIAYVLPKRRTTAPSVESLQEHLLQTLPDYMIPATFIRLQTLPLSSSGKIDLAALPLPANGNLLTSQAAKMPSTATEEKLLALVQKLLDQASITKQDNFFLAGGHSLLGMQLVMQLRKVMSVDVTLRQLFEAPTVERLAMLIDRKSSEQRLVRIWVDLLKFQEIKPESNFFDLGGDEQSLEALQKRVLEEFGKNVTVAHLKENPTIAAQIGLIQGLAAAQPSSPPGVLHLRNQGTQSAIFWVHYLSANLARAMSEDQAFIYLELTAEDVETLGASPTVQTIAASFLQKIVAVQPSGPYIIGGYCLGGILAYEVSSQLRKSGHDVSRLILLDTPSPSYLETANALTPRLSNPGYLLKRAMRIGFRGAFERVSQRMMAVMYRVMPSKRSSLKVKISQAMIEAAASVYKPEQYKGKVALILAEDHPPHINFLSEWQRLVPNTLHFQYVPAHHSDLIDGPIVHSVANAMAVQIKFAAEEASVNATDTSDESVTLGPTTRRSSH